MGISNPHIDNWGHFGGLVTGVFLGFILLENGLRALSRVGLRSAVEALSYPLAGCAISDHHGDLLLEEDLHSVRGVTRSSFLGALNRGLPETWTRYGQVFSHFENSANGDLRKW